jgi:hypothetical protein
MAIQVVEESCEVKGAKISISVINLENGTLILVSDRESQYRIGTMALATPVAHVTGEKVPSTFMLLGTGGELLAKVLAGRISADTGKVSICIVGLKEDEHQAISSILKATERIMEQAKSRQFANLVGSH